jgi:hypothetical protein
MEPKAIPLCLLCLAVFAAVARGADAPAGLTGGSHPSMLVVANKAEDTVPL